RLARRQAHAGRLQPGEGLHRRRQALRREDGLHQRLPRQVDQDEGGARRLKAYDGIILGAGHNSLVLQAYLGRAGLKVLCLERNDVAGGGLTTVEDPRLPGFLHNTHSFYHRALNRMPWYADLELARHGATYLEPELNVALVLKNGEALEWWTDFEKTAESFSQFSRQDAANL